MINQFQKKFIVVYMVVSFFYLGFVSGFAYFNGIFDSAVFIFSTFGILILFNMYLTYYPFFLMAVANKKMRLFSFLFSTMLAAVLSYLNWDVFSENIAWNFLKLIAFVAFYDNFIASLFIFKEVLFYKYNAEENNEEIIL